MQKILLLLFIFLFHGCSLKTLFVDAKINKVMVVKYAPYMKHHRAYFERTHLENIQGRKYLFLHNAKSKDLAILFHYKNKYMLYNMSKPEFKPLVAYVKSNTKPEDVLKAFMRKGFKPVHSLSSVGYTTSVAKRRYKDIKTLLVETRDYSRLQALYKKAIKNYNVQPIQSIQTKLPKSLIYSYYRSYKKHAKSKAQLAQLQLIGEKLHIEKKQKTKITVSKNISKKTSKKVLTKELNSTSNTHPRPIKREPKEIPQVTETQIEEKKQVIEPKVEEKKMHPLKRVQSTPLPTKPYRYYLYRSSLDELSSYISNKATKNALTYNQYTALNHRKNILKEEKLFNEGSLEELIAAYKINKNSKYKNRIMLLMKEKQETL